MQFLVNIASVQSNFYHVIIIRVFIITNIIINYVFQFLLIDPLVKFSCQLIVRLYNLFFIKIYIKYFLM